MIGDGDAALGPGKQSLLRPGKGLIAVDYPIEPEERGQIGRVSTRLCQKHAADLA
jgi:hypothetical protein